jgi:hypothetical protein
MAFLRRFLWEEEGFHPEITTSHNTYYVKLKHHPTKAGEDLPSLLVDEVRGPTYCISACSAGPFRRSLPGLVGALGLTKRLEASQARETGRRRNPPPRVPFGSSS